MNGVYFKENCVILFLQSISGIDDVGEAFSHLEECNWDLMVSNYQKYFTKITIMKCNCFLFQAAIQRVMPQEDAAPTTPAVPSVRSESSLLSRNASSSLGLNNFSTAPGPSNRNCPRWLKNASANNLGSSAAESAFVPGIFSQSFVISHQFFSTISQNTQNYFHADFEIILILFRKFLFYNTFFPLENLNVFLTENYDLHQLIYNFQNFLFLWKFSTFS